MNKSYISITKGMSGWFAVCLVYYEDIQGYDVYNTGIGYETKEEAIEEAKEWAKAEEMEFKE